MAKRTSEEDRELKEYLKKLGERIKTLRKEKGYANYEVFSYERNLSRSQVGRYEAGTEDLQFSSLLKVIRALDMTVGEFFSEGF